MKAYTVIFAAIACGCSADLHVYNHKICDTLEIMVPDTIIQWEPAINIPDSAIIYGDLQRVWVQHQDGTWHQYLKK